MRGCGDARGRCVAVGACGGWVAARMRERVEAGVKAMGFEIVGNPMLGLIAFSHPAHHAFALYGEIYRRGWFTSVTKEPPSLHLMLSPKHADFIDGYLADLEASLEAVGAGKAGEKVEARYS